MSSVPAIAQVQVVQEKGRPKEVFLTVKQAQGGYTLDVLEARDDRRPKASYSLRRVISELKFQDNDPCVLVLVTTEQEIQFIFKSAQEALAYHTYISDKSEVQAENRAISQLEDEMRLIWPFPGGSFF